jgi:hypothetical protein
MIFAGFRQLGITDEADQRDLYERVTGVRGLTQMRPEQKEAVAGELRRLGFKEAPSSRRPAERLSGRFAQPIRAFWLSGYNLGVFHNNDDRAILAFAKGQNGLEHLQFAMHSGDGMKVIEAIKAITRRDAGLPKLWRPVPGAPRQHYCQDGRVQVLEGQWEILTRLSARPCDRLIDFRGANVAIANVDGAELIALQKALGKLVRAAKAKAEKKAAA